MASVAIHMAAFLAGYRKALLGSDWAIFIFLAKQAQKPYTPLNVNSLVAHFKLSISAISQNDVPLRF